MAKKPPRKPSNHVDADKVYNQLSSDLFSALESANNENLSLANAAVKVAETLADPVSRAKAEHELQALSKSLAAANKSTKSRSRKLVLEHAAAKRQLVQERDAQLAALDASDKNGRALLKQDYKIKLVSLENSREDKLAEVLEDFTNSSERLTESALTVIRDLADDQDKAKQEYVSKLDGLLMAVDKAADNQRKEFDESRKRRSKALQAERNKPKSDEDELDEELKNLSGSFLQRRVFRPLIGKALSAVTSKIQDLKDATGVTAFQDLLESERARADRLDEIRFELATKRTTSSVREAIEEERSKHETEKEDEQEEVRRTVSQIASDLAELRTTSPLLALSSNHVDDDHLLEFNPSSPTSSPSTVVSNTSSSAARAASPPSAAEAYDTMSDDVLREREVRALEALSQGRKKGRDLGLMDYLMIGTVVAAGVYKTIDTFFDKTDLGGGVAKAMTLAMKPFVWAYNGITKFITKTIPDTLSDIKGWLKSLYDKTFGRIFGGTDDKKPGVVGRPASKAGSPVVSAVPSFSKSLESKTAPVSSVPPASPTLGASQSSASSVPSFSPSLDSRLAAKSPADTVLSQASVLKLDGQKATSTFQGASSVSNLDDSNATKVKVKYASTAGASASLVGSVADAYEKANGKKPTDKELLMVMADPAKVNSYMGEGFSERYAKATGSTLSQQLFSLTNEVTRPLSTVALTSATAPSNAPTQVNKAQAANMEPVAPRSAQEASASKARQSPKTTGMSTTPNLGASGVMNYAITDPNGSVFLLTR